MPATLTKPVEGKTFPHLANLDGISQEQLDVHYKLYNGYVTNVNTLYDKYNSVPVGTPEWNELKRRYGFEVNGVYLHELYFNNMKPSGGPAPTSGKLAQALIDNFGSVEAWQADFQATGKMRGIGWVIMYQDPATHRLINCWVSDHENGHPAGFTPVLVMDVWEHAFAVDYTPTGKPNYIEAFFKNINWAVVESRLA